MCRRSANRGYKRGSVLVFQNVPLPQQGTSQKSCKQEIPPARRRLHSPPANNAALLSHDRVQRRQRCAIRRLSNTPCPPPTHEHLDGSAMSSFRFLGTGRVQGLFFVIFQVPPVLRTVRSGRDAQSATTFFACCWKMPLTEVLTSPTITVTAVGFLSPAVALIPMPADAMPAR